MTQAGQFSGSYSVAFRAHVLRRDEHTLRSAYELGRSAVTADVAVPEVAAIHHDALRAALDAADLEDADDVVAAASEFLIETLSAYEMVKRGFTEERNAARAERRQAAMVRSLSAFLGNPSLLPSAHGALTEALQLIAEHARELTGAGAAVAAVRPAGGVTEAACSYADDAAARVDVESALRNARRIAGSGARIERELAGVESQGRVTAVLADFEGAAFGAIEAVQRADAAFSDVDEAVIAHVAQIASPVLERLS